MSKIFSNIKYLFSHNLKQDKQLGYAELDDLIDNLKYDLYDELADLKIPHIMDIHQTLEHLLATEESIVRFGDGELNLMYGDGIALQEYSPEISRRLTEVFCSRQKNLMVAIPYVCYHSKAGLTEVHRHFWYRTGPHYRKLMKKYIDYDQIYGAAEVSLGSSYQKDFDCGSYFSQFRKIWQDKDIVVVCGKTVFDKIRHNIFDNAQSVEYQYAPSVNAFSSYDEILSRALTIPKEKLVISILGPTAKILTYDLACRGYRALDFGHIAKSYDWFVKNIRMETMKDAANFFSPD